MEWLAADVGGTFSDIVGVDSDGSVTATKVLTTPADQSIGILNGVDAIGADLSTTEIFLHGSTIAINTVLEQSGATTAIITTEGFRDVYEIGRGNRPDPYNLHFKKPVPLVPRRRRYEISERTLADGTVRRPLDEQQVRSLVPVLKAAGVESIAVCLLHSYANPAHEISVGKILKAEWPDVYVTLSHEVLREYREYERTSTTVLNAYVGPRVSAYIDSLSSKLADRGFTGRLLIMQSNGGVMSPDAARRLPVKMMESGPVAGVIGAAGLATDHSDTRLISFDMGGTTAKASLVKDGEVNISPGYFIGGHDAGYPMALPVVDIVEVGAGGGSIGWVDAAGALKVGPQSAGADPGPACYGRGGTQATITDANLVLGRLGAGSFSTGDRELDVDAARQAIETNVATPLGIDVRDAALGMIAIANSQMSHAVRAVSVEKGEDPREYALVATGGAGPLHAVEIARELNIGTVLIPSLTGQFSAKGMLSSDVRYDAVQTHVDRFTPESLAAYETLFEALAAELTEQLLVDIAADRTDYTVSYVIELRYVGQEFTIPVPVPDGRLDETTFTGVRAAFDRLHLSLYGHHAPDEAAEALGVRVTIAAPITEHRTPAPAAIATDPAPASDAAPAPIGVRTVTFDADTVVADCPVYDRETLTAGHALTGPLIVQETSSSTVVHPGDRLALRPDGSLEITIDAASIPGREDAPDDAGTARPQTDPVTLEVVGKALVAHADEMATALQRTAYNPMIFEVRDFCVGLVDSNAELISQNLGGLPIFLADLAVAVKDGIDRYGLDGFEPGDVIIMNDPNVCGQHLNNMVVYTPCFVDGRVVAFPAVRAHWVDIGGARVGFASTASTDIYSEGLQLRSLKVMRAGEWNTDILQVIHDNIRTPESSMGDLRAAIAACRLGERRIQELAHRYGVETLMACIEEIRDKSELLSREAVAAIPDGEYSASSWMDDDGRNRDQHIQIAVRVVIDGSDMHVDFSEMNAQVEGPINSGRSGGVAAARVAFKMLTLPNRPVDEGAFRNLKVELPDGKLISARKPAPLGQWSVPLPTVVDTIIKALAPVMPETAPAAHKGDMSGFSFYGFDERRKSRFVYLNINGGGWGGRPHEDGPSACVSICQGDVHNIPIEVQETRYPLLCVRHALRGDSGGAGLHRGGLGLELRLEATQPIATNIANERVTCPPWGLNGGLAAEPAMARIDRVDGSSQAVRKRTGVPLAAGDQVTVATAGGGGWGAAAHRDPTRVASDVMDGYVSVDAARTEYGVVVDAAGAVDVAETQRLRSAMLQAL